MIINIIIIMSSPSPLSSSSSDELLAKVVLGLNSNEESGRAHWAAAMASPGTRYNFVLFCCWVNLNIPHLKIAPLVGNLEVGNVEGILKKTMIK